MPGGQCPYCKQNIKVERKGGQNCQECGGRLNVDISDNSIQHQDDSKYQTRTYIRKG